MSSELFEDISTETSLPDDFLEDDVEYEEANLDWEDTWLRSEWKRRRVQGRDIFILIIGENGSTGTGKSTLACWLAWLMDDSRQGFTKNKATSRTDEFLRLYNEVEEQSAIVGDEAQGMADSRRAMSSDNVKLSQAMSRARFREVYVVMTLPSADMLDNRMKQRADVLIVCDEDTKGVARVYELWMRDLDSSNQVMTRKQEEITWDALDGYEPYEKLEQQKQEDFESLLREYYSQDDEDESDQKSEEEKIKEKAREKAVELHRDGLSYRDIQEELPPSPHGSSEKWSTSKLSKWLSDVEKGANLD